MEVFISKGTQSSWLGHIFEQVGLKHDIG